jgi:deoxyribodipyrimidine photolyase-related protein
MNSIWILGDQLSLENAALAQANPADSVVLMIESRERGSALRYHQQKLVLIYSAMRHFADELRRAGWRVDYHLLEKTPSFEHGLLKHLQEFAPSRLVLAEPNSFAETEAVQKLARKQGVEIELLPTAQFLVSRDDFRSWAGDSKRLLMENHYRRMRKQHGWLMQKNGEPAGGAWNFDADNRETFASWQRVKKPVLKSLREKPDKTTGEVIRMVTREFRDNPGGADGFWLPVDRDGAQRWLKAFIHDRLPHFGAFEDVMVAEEPTLFHSVLSPMLNIGLLTPRECVEAAIESYEAGKTPLNSVEGFVRQIIGWREFINGIYWLRGAEYKGLNALDARRPLPEWFYTAETPMRCLRLTIQQVVDTGWNHHIQRLMVLGNFMLLAGIRPQEGLRWFLEMYVDAFDWVMAANVIGMALHADGGFMATKPYAATSTYIRRMSNYCEGCTFNPDEKTGPKACPFNYLYWDFLDRHDARFGKNPRMAAIMSGWKKRNAASKKSVRESAENFLREHVPL